MDTQLLATQLTAALESRVVIEQAKGMVAERTDLGVPEAFVRIRAYARAHNQRLTTVCVAIVEGRIDGADLGPEPPRPGRP
jgi:AmiR/NasT family two-component response regulator